MAVLKSKAKFTEPFVGKREVIVMLSVQGGQATASATELDYDAVHALEQTIVDLTFVADTPQTDLVKESPSLVKDLVNAFCEDGTWLERQGVYTLTLAEAKQRAVDIIEAVSRKDTADTPQTDCGWK